MNHDPSRPKRVGRFELRRPLEHTLWADRFAGYQPGPSTTRREVVVELLNCRWSKDEELRTVYLQEAAAASKLLHPNLSPICEVLSEDSATGFVAEGIPGQSLLTLWERLNSESISLAVRLHIICEVLGTLEYAQTQAADNQPLCHGDLGPHNIWLGQDGQVFLRGLGFSRSMSLVSQRLNQTVHHFGYASPEVLRGAATDSRADIYSSGVMLWEAVAGRRRIFHDKPADIIRQRLALKEPSLSSLFPKAPGRLLAQCQQALALDPDLRYECLADFREDLMGFLDDVYGEDRSPLRHELVSLLRKSSSSLPSRITTKTRKLPAPQPSGNIAPFSSVPTLAEATPSTKASTRPEPDTAGHAAFSATSREKQPPPRIVKLAIPGLVLLIACAVFSIRSLRSQQVALQPTINAVSAAQPIRLLADAPIPTVSIIHTDTVPAERPSLNRAEMAAGVAPAVELDFPTTENLSESSEQTIGQNDELPTLRMEQLRLVGGSRSGRAVRSQTMPFEGQPLSDSEASLTPKRHKASSWRRRRASKPRPIDERDPYAK